jgi:prevent-host-death family protein
MGTPVKIAELKSRLSAYLRSVRAGNEIVVKDRETPVARIVPFQPAVTRLSVIVAKRSHTDIDRLPFFRPKGLKRSDVEAALRWTRRERKIPGLR